MSEPVRTVTPRLQAALEEAVRLLDALLKLALDPAAAGAVAGLRAELLEAFDQATEGSDGWISCAERIPDPGSVVLAVVRVGGRRGVASLIFCGEEWINEDSCHIDEDTISHWMPLPKPPAEDPKEIEE